MPKLLLEVNGQRYGGWLSIRVRRGLEELADAFTVKYIDQWGTEPYPIQEGDAVAIYIERDSSTAIPSGLLGGSKGDLVLTGYVDDAEQSYDRTSHTMTVMGRSKTGDLVDCVAIYKSRQIRGQTFPALAAKLCEPFGIDVITEVADIAEIRRMTLQPDEKVYPALQRVASKRGLLLITDTAGNLIITRASEAKAVGTRIVEGQNIKSAQYRGSWKHRHSDYAFRSQMATDDDWNGPAASHLKGSVSDPEITRYRPMEVIAEHQGDRDELIRRATWERNARAGKGQRLTVTVPGWHHADGLWEPNTLVHVESPFLRIDDQLLIGSVEFSQDRATGTITRIELVGQGAFDILGAPPKLRKRKRLFGGLAGLELGAL